MNIVIRIVHYFALLLLKATLRVQFVGAGDMKRNSYTI
jgi:hypothetical protein